MPWRPLTPEGGRGRHRREHDRRAGGDVGARPADRVELRFGRRRELTCSPSGGRIVDAALPRGGVMAQPDNPVAQAIDCATGDWSMSGDAMRWSPELAEQGALRSDVPGLATAVGIGAG